MTGVSRITFVGDCGFTTTARALDAERTDAGWKLTLTGSAGIVVIDMDTEQFAVLAAALEISED